MSFPRLNLLRRMLTRGLRVDANQNQVRRGEVVEALVTISATRGLGDLEVGLVCTESYDYESTTSSTESSPSTTSRETAHAVAYEAWQPIESAVGAQTFRLTVPPDAPFSYEGDCLSFMWEIVARGGKKYRLDARVSQQIAVLP